MIHSVYFTSFEMRCRCEAPECDAQDMDPLFLLTMDRIRHRIQRPLIVTSARRCKKHNMLVGGASRSSHLRGLAMDIMMPKDEQAKFMDVCRQEGITGYGRSGNWVHLDQRPGEFRIWTY